MFPISLKCFPLIAMRNLGKYCQILNLMPLVRSAWPTVQRRHLLCWPLSHQQQRQNPTAAATNAPPYPPHQHYHHHHLHPTQHHHHHYLYVYHHHQWAAATTTEVAALSLILLIFHPLVAGAAGCLSTWSKAKDANIRILLRKPNLCVCQCMRVCVCWVANLINWSAGEMWVIGNRTRVSSWLCFWQELITTKAHFS